MPLQSSGAISLNDMHVEAGGTTGTEVSANDSDIRDLISKASGAQSSFSEFYGASSGPTSYEVNGLNSTYNSKYDQFNFNVYLDTTARDKWVDPFVHGGNAFGHIPAGTYYSNYANFLVTNSIVKGAYPRFDYGNHSGQYFPLYNNDSNPVSFDSFWNHCYLKWNNTTLASWTRSDINTKNNTNDSSLGLKTKNHNFTNWSRTNFNSVNSNAANAWRFIISDGAL